MSKLPKGSIVTVGIRAQPIGSKAEQVMDKCIAPLLQVRGYLVLFRLCAMEYITHEGREYKLYTFQFRISAPDHYVDKQEAHDLVKKNLVPWLDK